MITTKQCTIQCEGPFVFHASVWGDLLSPGGGPWLCRVLIHDCFLLVLLSCHRAFLKSISVPNDSVSSILTHNYIHLQSVLSLTALLARV